MSSSITITEDVVEGYETEIDGYNVTNTHKPEEPDKPKTGDDGSMTAMIGLSAASLAGAAALFVLWRRRREEA